MANRDEIINRLTSLFEKDVSDPVRQGLMGNEIDRILSKYFDRITPRQLAIALFSKYGGDLFNKKYRILKTIINSYREDVALELAERLELTVNSNNVYDKVIEAINKNPERALDIFNQSRYFLNSKPKDDRETLEEIVVGYNEEVKCLGYPHDYQNSVKTDLHRRIGINSGRFSALVVMPTGSGKTRTALEFIIDAIRVKDKINILWVVDSPELAEQALQAFAKLWRLRGDRKIRIARCFGNHYPELNLTDGTNVIFAGFDKVISLKSSNDNLYENLKFKTNILIIDEAHYSLALTYEGLIDDIVSNCEEIIKIGLTATPLRPEDTEFYNLQCYFENRIIEFRDESGNIIPEPLRYLQERKYLAEIETEYLRIAPADINQESKVFNDAIIKRLSISISQGKQVIVFAMSKDHAIALDILLKYYDFKSECIVGETSFQERQLFFEEFTEKRLNILINYDILSTGIDLPRVDELYLLRKFGNYTTAMQVLGRALRGEKNGGNPKNRIISIISNQQIILGHPSDLYNLIKNMY